jgi:AcrR family transcriptional regulator
MKQRIPAAATASRPAPSPARRQRLLEAAERLFSKVGYRAVTIAAIAAEAGFAKATVYAYFADKDDLFRAVGEALAARLVNAVEGGLADAGSTAQKIARALAAKDAIILSLILNSPHAGELFEARDRLVRDAFDAADVAILARIEAALDDGVQRDVTPAQLARVLVRASRGLAARVTDVAAMRADIDYLVTHLIDAARVNG